jgi:hypothetical protein
MRTLVMLIAAAGFAGAGAAAACGVCIEDKIAATYDHAVIQRAIGRHQQVVFVAIEGPVAASVEAWLAAAARTVPGVEAGSVRTSASPPAFSFAIDGAQAPEAALAGFHKAVPAPTRLTVIRIMRDGKLVEPSRGSERREHAHS